MASVSLSNKREVREHAKQALQPLVDDGTVEAEELRTVVKTVGDAVTTLPAEGAVVEVAAFTELLGLLTAASAPADSLAKVQDALAASQNAVSRSIASDKASATGNEASAAGASAEAAHKEKSFTFGALKARLAKKKEELQQVANAKPETTGAPTTVTSTANVSVNASAAPSEVNKGGPSTNVSLGASPALQPVATDAPQPLPPVELPGSDAAREGSKQPPQEPQRQSSAEAPPSAKPEPIVLTAAPIDEDDIYAEFTRRGRGRGRGRGTDGDVRGGRGWRGGRGAVVSSFNPVARRSDYAPPSGSEPPTPPYAPPPTRGRGGYGYAGAPPPARGGYLQPPPSVQQAYRGRGRGRGGSGEGYGFRPY